MKSSIYLPRDGGTEAPSGLLEDIQSSSVAMILKYALAGSRDDLNPFQIRELDPSLFDGYSDQQVVKATRIILGIDKPLSPSEGPVVVSDDADTAFRRVEHAIIRLPQSGEQLRVEDVAHSRFGPVMAGSLDKVLLVRRLRETRALVGFQRVNPAPGPDIQELKSLLRYKEPVALRENWLPAHVVFGEGILIELSDARIREWEHRPDVSGRVRALRENYSAQLRQQGRDPQPYLARLSARRVLIHTLSHLLVNELVFAAGYSSASLRERLYVSDDQSNPMAALLIYTAAGDADGSLGGLVRMGEPERLEPVLVKALEGARWCASDPVCMEAGEHGGQGPGSCNLAACHNCALVPETTCEDFNRYLDRWMVCGSEESRGSGFFK